MQVQGDFSDAATDSLPVGEDILKIPAKKIIKILTNRHQCGIVDLAKHSSKQYPVEFVLL